MALAAHNFTIQDDAGNIVTDVDIEVRLDTVGQPLVALFSDRDGLSALGNPFTSATGTGHFHVAGGAYRIRASKAGFEAIQRYVGIGTASEADAEDLIPDIPETAFIYYASLSAALADDLSAFDVVYVGGYGAEGDGGAAAWVNRATNEPSHGAKDQDAAGNWFELLGPDNNLYQVGCINDGTTDNLTPMTNAISYMMETGSRMFVPPGLGFYLSDLVEYAYPDDTIRSGTLYGPGGRAAKIIVGSPNGGIKISSSFSAGRINFYAYDFEFEAGCENAGRALDVVHHPVPAVIDRQEVRTIDIYCSVGVPPTNEFYYWGDFPMNIEGHSRPLIERVIVEEARDPDNAAFQTDNSQHDKYLGGAGQGGIRIWNCYGANVDVFRAQGGRTGILVGNDPDENPEGGTFRHINVAGFARIGVRSSSPRGQFEPGFTIDGNHLNCRDYNFVVAGHAFSGTATAGGASSLTGAAADLERPLTSGTAQAGGASTITLASGNGLGATEPINCQIEITGGTGAGQIRTISAFDAGTEVATVSSAWSTQPDNTSTYEIKTGGNGYFIGWTLWLTAGPGYGQAQVVDGYNRATRTLTVPSSWDTADTGTPGALTRYILEPPDTEAGGRQNVVVNGVASWNSKNEDRADGVHGVAKPTDFYLVHALDASITRNRFSFGGGSLTANRRCMQFNTHTNNGLFNVSNNDVQPALEYFIHNPDNGIKINARNNTFADAIVPISNGNFTTSGNFASLGRCVHTGGMGLTTGNDSTPVTTETYYAEVFIPDTVPLTGIALLTGSAVAGNVKLYLADAAGNMVAEAASTALSGTNAYQHVPFTAPYGAIPGTYYVVVQFNNTGARYRAHTVGSFMSRRVTSTTFGTFPSLGIPSAPANFFVANYGPIATLY